MEEKRKEGIGEKNNELLEEKLMEKSKKKKR